jgi:hypothetical protein
VGGSGVIWTSVIERFEQRAPASVMARTALEHALPAEWPDARASSGIDAVFDAHRERQYSRELLFSTVVELVTLVSLGLRPSLHAAARRMETLPVTLAALYDKVNRTEPAILRALACAPWPARPGLRALACAPWPARPGLRALVRGSAERLAPVAAAVDGGTILPGWRLRVLDGNHLPASEKRLAPLRGHRGAALPGQTLVVYDPDSGLVTDIVASEDAHQSERASVAPLLASAQPGQLWIAAKSQSDWRGIATSAHARSCRAGTRRTPASSCASTPASSCASTPASSCASTPAILGWPGQGIGMDAAAPRRARRENRRSRSRARGGGLGP